MSYRLTYTLEAAATHEEMAPERREILDLALAALVDNPYHPASSHVGNNEDDRKAQAAPGILVEYVVVHGWMVIVVIEVFEESIYFPR
jgi:hypothetical protein